ncbi:MAG TPA: hypothetical protein VGM92_00605 [Candidatus Kapabacteria bacterium]|jgi:hypothetical protein
MSKKETPMTRRYWERVGGTLVEEFCAQKKTSETGRRLLDAIIITEGEQKIASQSEVSIEGKDIIIVQAKANRLGMSVMGQALFSIGLMQKFKPRSIRSVALVAKDDRELREIFLLHENVEIVIDEYPATK